jgi:methylmalonyl-CoA mutase
MTDPETLPLPAEFPAATRDDWRKLVDGVLKGGRFERLIGATYDGLKIEPLYPRAAAAAPIAGRAPGKPWTIMQRADHPDPKAANAQALADLENGANGLTLVFAGSLNAGGYGLDSSPETIECVLDGIALEAGVTIDFNLSAATRVAVDNVVALVTARKLAPASVDLRASLNPIGGLAASGTVPKPWSELSKIFAAAVRALAEQGFRGPLVVADGRIIHNAGSSEAQELAFALATAVDCLRALEAGGMALDAARRMIYFRLAADADQFLTIAKFRAIRKLWTRIEAACGLTPQPAVVAAETAWRMLACRDPQVNILRNAIAVAAAAIGGADNIAVLPHTAAIGLPDAFARRVARNTQLVLLEESNLAKVADPAAGSGAIEDLTEKLCAAAWALFQRFDAAGGAWAALEQDLIQREVAAVRDARMKAAATRKDAITGVSIFPDLHEAAVETDKIKRPAPSPSQGTQQICEPLPNIRLAEPFEKLREASDAVLAKTGVRPKIFLAALGTPAEFTPRLNFAQNFFAAGGFDAVVSADTAPAALPAAFKASGAALAALCSTDKIYANEASAAAAALKEAGARHIYLAGKAGERESEWRTAGIQSFVSDGSDALATLQAAYDILGIKVR